MRQVTKHDFEALIAAAERSTRKRAHQNLHTSFNDKVQRILIGFVKGSYVEPHYHAAPNQWEMFALLQGRLHITLYDSTGKTQESIIVDAENAPGRMIEFSPHEIHSVECLSETAVMLEIKEGPFDPQQAKTFPKW